MYCCGVPVHRGVIRLACALLAPALAAAQEVAHVAGTEFMPTVLVPLTGLVFPAAMMGAFFLYASADDEDRM